MNDELHDAMDFLLSDGDALYAVAEYYAGKDVHASKYWSKLALEHGSLRALAHDVADKLSRTDDAGEAERLIGIVLSHAQYERITYLDLVDVAYALAESSCFGKDVLQIYELLLDDIGGKSEEGLRELARRMYKDKWKALMLWPILKRQDFRNVSFTSMLICLKDIPDMVHASFASGNKLYDSFLLKAKCHLACHEYEQVMYYAMPFRYCSEFKPLLMKALEVAPAGSAERYVWFGCKKCSNDLSIENGCKFTCCGLDVEQVGDESYYYPDDFQCEYEECPSLCPAFSPSSEELENDSSGSREMNDLCKADKFKQMDFDQNLQDYGSAQS